MDAELRNRYLRCATTVHTIEADYATSIATLVRLHSVKVVDAIHNAIPEAQRVPIEPNLLDDLQNKRLPMFFVFKSRTPRIYMFDTACLRTTPAWYILNYNGPNSQTTIDNRKAVEKRWGKILRPGAAPGDQLDEYPFASTSQGGPGAQADMVPGRENSIQGGDLGSFYRIHLGRQPKRPFLVVPVPI